jgi:hypothetical protein
LLQRGVGEHGESLPLIEIISRSTRVRQTFDAIVNSGSWDAAEEAQQRTLFGPGTTKFPTKILKEMIEGSISQENMDKKQLEALYEKAAGHELFIHLRETEQWDNLKLSLTYVLNDYDQLLLRLRILFVFGKCPYGWDYEMLKVSSNLHPLRLVLWSSPSHPPLIPLLKQKRTCPTASRRQNVGRDGKLEGSTT